MDESFDMIRKDMRNLKIRGGCNRFDETKNFRKRKIAGKSGNHSSIPLTIHATESIIQLPISHLGVDFTRSQETRIEFASRGRDPDLSSLIDGAREIGGGVVKCKGGGRFSFFLSFFFPPPIWRGIIGTVSVSACFEKVDQPILCAVCRGILSDYTRNTKNTYYHANLFLLPFA